MSTVEFVRPATASDLVELCRLEVAYREAAGSTRRGGEQWLRSNPALDLAGWNMRVSDNSAVTVVAGIDGVVLGFASLRLHSAAHSTSVAAIDGIFVEEGARELGLGDAMLAALVDGARRLGAEEIEATALPGDRDTKNLFERAGLVARLITVSKPLS